MGLANPYSFQHQQRNQVIDDPDAITTKMMEGNGDAVMVFDMAMDQVVVPTMEDGAQFLSKTANNLGSELMLLWQSESFMDVDLICAGNQTVRTHRVILAALSPFFRKIFMDWGPAMETDINIVLAEVKADTIRDFLQKIYQGDLSVAIIDPSLTHLQFEGEALKEPVRSVTAVADLITKAAAASIIKSEPQPKRNYDELENFFLEPAPKKAKIKEEPAEQDDDDDYDPSEPLSSVVDISAAVKSKKSKVWNFFTRLEKDVARCKSCEVTIKTQKGNTTGMTRHLFRAHSDMYNQLEVMKQKDNDSNGSDDDDDEDFSPFKGISLKSGRKRKKGQQASKSTRKRANQKRSKVWQFFDQQADGTEARCNACMIMIKTDMGNTSGLISHLRSSHPEQFEELSALREGGGGDEAPASTSGARNSPVWQFYEELGSNRVKCIKCNVVLKYYYGTTSGLLRHLRRSHAEAYDAIKNDDNSGNANNAENVGGATSSTLDVDNETLWKFFHKSESSLPANDSANCVECMLEVTNQHGSLVTSCEEHLRGCHTDLLEQYESQRKAYVQELIKSDKTAIKRRYTSRVVASAIWSFFKKTEDSTSHNQCLTCLVEIDCSQNTTAMVKHLEDTHPEQHESFKKQSGIDAKDIKVPSAIWKHFLRTEDPKKHKCIVSCNPHLA